MSSELKPCPFCGRSAKHGLGKVQHDSLHGDPFQNYVVWCPVNCAKMVAADKERAIARWNTRAPDPSHEAMRVALEELDAAVLDGLCNSGVPGFDGNRLGLAREAARTALSTLNGEVKP